MEKQVFRHELKFQINKIDYSSLRQKLLCVMKQDSNTLLEGSYLIRSIYFDNLYDKSLQEKINGNLYREKYRIRTYNCNDSTIKLEKKSKHNLLCQKQSKLLTINQYNSILIGDYSWIWETKDAFLMEFYINVKNYQLKPKVIVEYHREPFLYSAGNVRVTLDSQIRTSTNLQNFFSPELCGISTSLEPFLLMEVKYDNYLPEIIQDILQLKYRQVGGFSKYAASRIFG